MGKVENLSNKKSLAKLESQIVNLDLVIIKDSVPVANTKHLEEYEKALIAHTDDMIRNTLDIEIIEEEIKNRTTINSNFKEYRLGFTKPLTSIPKMFTPFEKSFDEQRKRLQVRVEEMKESTFKIAEAKIKEVLNSLQEQHKDIEINMSVFDSFVEVQRKVKGMLPNDKNVLSKASMTKIETEFNKHVAPILEAKRVKEQSELEHKQFQSYLPDTSSNNINELEAVKMNLLKQKESLAELYPINCSFFEQTLNSMISKVKSSIKVINTEVEAQKLRDVDKPISDEIKKLSEEFTLNKEDDNWIEKATEELRVLYSRAKLQETKKLAVALSDKFKEQQADNLAVSILVPVVEDEIIEEAVVSTEKTEESSVKRVYTLADEQAVMFDIEVMRVEAESEAEAIEKYVEAFRESITRNGVR